METLFEQSQKVKDYTSIKTFFATMVLLIFFFIQGVVVVINNIEGTESAVIRGVIIGLAAIAAILLVTAYRTTRKRRGYV